MSKKSLTTLVVLGFMLALLFPVSAFALDKTDTTFVISHAHLDNNWQWGLNDTIASALNTFDLQDKNVRKYPEYIFTASDAQQWKYVKDRNAGLWNRVKENVASGQMVPAGGAWVQHDCAVISGESMVRQYLMGQKFFENEFGIKCDDAFLPDNFAFSPILPQILQKSGINTFVQCFNTPLGFTWRAGETNTLQYPKNNALKITPGSWGNSQQRFNVFNWVGVDGTPILVLNPTDYGGGGVLYEAQTRTAHNYPTSIGLKTAMTLMNRGDTGGGPMDSQVSDALKAMPGYQPTVKFGTLKDYYDSLSQTDLNHIADEATFAGRLDELRMFFGVFVSNSAIKKLNRLNEITADEAERLASTALYLGRGSYPQAAFQSAWEVVLMNQSHDTMAGVDDGWVSNEALAANRVSYNSFLAQRNSSADYLLGLADTTVEDASGVPVAIYNPLAFERHEVTSAAVKFAARPETDKVLVIDNTTGEGVPAQVVSVEADGTYNILFEADVPSFGYKIYIVVPSEDYAFTQSETGMSSDAGAKTMGSNRYSVTIDSKGNISSIVDKQNGYRELLSNSVEFAMDNGVSLQRMDHDNGSWCLDEKYFYPDYKPLFINDPTSVTLVDSGPVMTRFKVVKEYKITGKTAYDNNPYGITTVTQYVTLYSVGDRVDVYHEVDLQDRDSLLEASFNLNVSNPYATYDLSYGTMVMDNNNFDPTGAQVHYEMCGQMWADITDISGDYGVSIFNDCKYGWDKPENNQLRLTLISSHSWTDENIDRGMNTFMYSICGHAGDWSDSAIPQKARELNYPLLAYQLTPHSGRLGKEFSMASIDSDDVIITAVKKAEDNDDLIFRLVELSGKSVPSATVTMYATAGTKIFEARETDLIEDNPVSIASTSDSFTITDIRPYDIRTVRVNWTVQPTIEEACNRLTWDVIRNKNILINEVTTDLTLPLTGGFDSVISWDSDNTDVIGVDGTVIRPDFAEGNKTVTLTATLTREDGVGTVEFVITVLKMPYIPNDAEKVAWDTEWLTWAVIRNANVSEDDVKTILTLLVTGENGSDISWSSNNTVVIAADGKVTRPALGSGDATVMLTATITSGEESDYVTFTLVVPEKEPQPDFYELDADDLWNGVGGAKVNNKPGTWTHADWSGYPTIYGWAGETVELTFTGVGIEVWGWCFNPEWSPTNDPNRPFTQFTVDGGHYERPRLYRPEGSDVYMIYSVMDLEDAEHFFYAKGDAYVNICKIVVYTSSVTLTDQESVDAACSLLTWNTIRNQNALITEVTTNLTLPLASSKDTTISWFSDNTGVVANNGTVTSPAYGEGNKTITLTATVTKGDAEGTVEFVITVPELPYVMTDAEKVAADEAWLVWSIISNANTLTTDVKTNLTLPASGANGSGISWSSSDAGVIAADGTVTRPVNGSGPVMVTLTANITCGTESGSVTFTLVVPEMEAVVGVNMMENPGFELGNLTGWGSYDMWQPGNEAQISSSGAHEGNYCGILQHFTYLYQYRDLEPYTTYTLTAYCKVVSGSLSSAPGQAFIYAAYLDGTSNRVETAIVGSAGGDYQLYTLTFTTGSYVEGIEVGAATTVNGTIIYCDDFILVKQGLNDADKAAADAEWLTWDVIRNANTLKTNVKTNLTFPANGENGSAISWSSSDGAVIAADGTVTRPVNGSGSVTVTLTAAITCGLSGESVMFILVVPEEEGQLNYYEFDANDLWAGVDGAVVKNASCNDWPGADDEDVDIPTIWGFNSGSVEFSFTGVGIEVYCLCHEDWSPAEDPNRPFTILTVDGKYYERPRLYNENGYGEYLLYSVMDLENVEHFFKAQGDQYIMVTRIRIYIDDYTVPIMERVATPIANVSSGQIPAGTQVTLTCTTAGADIYFTTDDSTPISTSAKYTGPITVNTAMTLKAVAVKDGMINSCILTAIYTIASADSVIIKDVEIPFKIINGITTLEPAKEPMISILRAARNDIVIDLKGYEAVDIFISADWFKDIDKTIIIITAKGTDSVKTKSLWNNSGKIRLISVRNGKISFKNI